MSEAGTPANSLKRRKVATPSLSPVPGKETVSVADGNKQHSSLRRQSVPRDYVSVSAQKHIPDITRNASLWDPDTVEARKVAVDLAEALITPEAQTRFDQVKDLAEMTETSVLHTIRAAALSRTIYNKYLQEAAESREKISMLNQDLEEAKTEVKLEKISQEMAKRLVEQAKQEKKVVELKYTSEKACLKRKIQELEMELQQQKDKFKDALVDAEVDGYNKCVKKAREMGLKYENLLLDHVNGPMRQEEYIVHSATSNSGKSNAYTDMGNATDPTAAIPTVSARSADVAAVQRALDAKNEARAEKARRRRERKSGQVPEASEARAPKSPVVNILDDPPVDQEEGPHPQPSLVTRPLKRPQDSSSAAHTGPIDAVDVPDSMALLAPQDGLSFGSQCAAMLYVTPEQTEILSCGATETSKNALAYASQTLLWIGAAAQEAKKIEVELGQAQKNLNKANQDNKQLVDRVKDLERREREAVDQVKDLNIKNTELKAGLEAAEKAKVDAQAEWTEYGFKVKLEKAKELGWDYKQLLGPKEFDPLEPESEDEEHQDNEHEGEN